MGYEPRVFCPRSSQTYSECKRELLAVRHLSLNPALAFASLANAVRSVVKHQPVSILCHAEYDAYLFSMAVHLAYGLGLIKYRPFLVRLRFCQTNQPRALLVNWAFDVTTVASRVLSDRLLGNRYMDSRKVEVLPPIIDLDYLLSRPGSLELSQPGRALLASHSGPVVLFGGAEASSSEAQMLAIELLSGLVESHSDLLFIFPEQHESTESFKRQLSHIGLGAHVYFGSSNDSFDALVQAADVVLLPGDANGFELPQMKVIAHAKPVVLSDLGMLSEFLQDECSAMVCSPPYVKDSQKEWFAATSKLLSDPLFAQKMGQNARQLVFERLGLHAHLRRLTKAFSTAAICDE